jgi:molybdenum cofactor cytidylyltransferase
VTPPLPALVLAAGASSRLGRPKQLVEVRGEALLRRTVRITLAAGFAPVHVVLGAEGPACRAVLGGLAVSILENAAWAEGMGSSLRRGMQALAPDAPAVLLLVCDQPRLSSAALEQLRDLYLSSGARITAARYAGRLGVPAIFARGLFPELAQVAGDQGARAILAAHRAEAAALDLPLAAVDVDTAEDLAELELDPPQD